MQPKDLLGPDGKPLRAGDIKTGYTYVVDSDGRVSGHTGHNRKQRRKHAAEQRWEDRRFGKFIKCGLAQEREKNT